MSNIPLTDLRIGNYVKYNLEDNAVSVETIEYAKLTCKSITDRYYKDFHECFSGIPIAEEWLERTNIKDIIPEYNNVVISLEETDNGYIFELDIPRAGFYKISREMKYLHDLQNVVKELFGTELTLK